MTNDVTKSVFGGKVGMVNASALADALAASAAKDPRAGAGEGDFLNFSGKGGRYELGVKKEPVDPDEAWLVNVSAFEDGWICWKDSRPIATRLYPLGSPVPPQDTSEHGPFPRDGDGWFQAKSMTLRSIDSGVQAYFKINSVSGVSVFASLQKDVVQRIRAGMAAWPVIKLGMEKFQAKGFTNYKPIITVIGWLDDNHVQQLAEVFDDENAVIDLEQMFVASAQNTALPSGGETNGNGNGKVKEEPEEDTPPPAAPQVARRNRRAAL